MEERIKNLVTEITRHAQLYYEGNPEISDDEFDKLVEELKIIDPDNEVLHTTGWGYNPSGSKVEHKYGNMGSIERKPRKIEDIPKSVLNYGLIRVSAKLDGISASAEFRNGKLMRGITRGNGVVGVDRTDKISRILDKCMIKSLPDNFTGAIRGELVISNDTWKYMVEQGIAGDKSSRNFVAGVINRNEMTDDVDFIDFVPYKIIASENHEFNRIVTVSSALTKYFVNAVDYTYYEEYEYSTAITQEKMEDLLKYFREKYPCDGCVITSGGLTHKEDGVIIYDEVAYKFDSETAISRVDHIDWNLTRTGLLIPTVCIDPVNLGGATIRRTAGFNARFICENKIGPNAKIEIQRSGEVIPDIVRVVEPTDSKVLTPLVCPVCGEESIDWLDYEESTHIICCNPNCSNKDYRDLQTWVNNIAKVDGIGDTLKFKFLNELGIHTIEELYKYNPDNWDDKGQIQRKKFRIVLDKLINDKVDPVDALCALNIPRLGRTTATKLIADEASPLELIFRHIYAGVTDTTMYKDDMAKIVGPATAESIYKNLDKMRRLIYVNDRVDWTIPKESTQDLIPVCITGKLSVKRSEFEKYLLDHGYKNSGINKDTVYLITDNPSTNSSKARKARDLGIKIISESTMRNLIEN